MPRPKIGAMRRLRCGCVLQYAFWDRTSPSTAFWDRRIMCAGHATPEYHARMADEAAQDSENTAELPRPRNAHATYPYSISEYLSFFRTCGLLRPYETVNAIAYSTAMARIRWQTRQEN